MPIGSCSVWRDADDLAWQASRQLAAEGEQLGLAELEQLFAELLRLWRDHAAAPWRATLIDATRPSEQRHFASLDALLAFLLRLTDDRAPPDGAVGAAAAQGDG